MDICRKIYFPANVRESGRYTMSGEDQKNTYLPTSFQL